MSTKDDNYNAAEAEFIAVFGTEKAPLKKELLGMFVKGFDEGYEFAKNHLARANSALTFTWAITYCIKQAQIHVAITALKSKDNSPRWIFQRAKALGKGLGLLLEAVEEGLTNNRADIAAIFRSPDALPVCILMVKWLQPSYTQARSGRLSRRIERISKNHASTLHEDQQKLILEIATIFK